MEPVHDEKTIVSLHQHSRRCRSVPQRNIAVVSLQSVLITSCPYKLWSSGMDTHAGSLSLPLSVCETKKSTISLSLSHLSLSLSLSSLFSLSLLSLSLSSLSLSLSVCLSVCLSDCLSVKRRNQRSLSVCLYVCLSLKRLNPSAI